MGMQIAYGTASLADVAIPLKDGPAPFLILYSFSGKLHGRTATPFPIWMCGAPLPARNILHSLSPFGVSHNCADSNVVVSLPGRSLASFLRALALCFAPGLRLRPLVNRFEPFFTPFLIGRISQCGGAQFSASLCRNRVPKATTERSHKLTIASRASFCVKGFHLLSTIYAIWSGIRRAGLAYAGNLIGSLRRVLPLRPGCAWTAHLGTRLDWLSANGAWFLFHTKSLAQDGR